MSALTLRKKRNLGNCITNSTLNPRTHQFTFDQPSKCTDSNWTVESFAQDQMENGNQITRLNHSELIKKLQVFDSSVSTKEITHLLEQNQGDFISVMNILKEKSQRKKSLKQTQKKKILRGNELKQKILERLRQKKSKKKIPEESPSKSMACIVESPTESVEKSTKKLSQPEPEKVVDPQELVSKFMKCNSELDVKQLVSEICQDMNDNISKLKRAQCENYVLKMGIIQRREITQNEIKKRVETEYKLKELEEMAARLAYENRNLQQSSNSMWMKDHFGKDCF